MDDNETYLIEENGEFLISNQLPNKPGPKKKLKKEMIEVESIENPVTETVIESISDFINAISNLDSQGFSFFRGDKSRDSYSLSPKVYATEFQNLFLHLDESIEEFAALTLGRNSLISNGFLEDMINAQHYELPTRLLDWTESAIIALFFAVSPDKMNSKDAIVWALNPTALNAETPFLKKYGYVPIFPSKQDENLVKELEDYYRSPKSENIKYPIAIKTRKINPRIDAQRGVFVLFCHNDDKKCLTKYENANKFLHKIVIPNRMALEIHRELTFIGITQYSIFPELNAISVDLINKYNQRGR